MSKKRTGKKIYDMRPSKNLFVKRVPKKAFFIFIFYVNQLFKEKRTKEN